MYAVPVTHRIGSSFHSLLMDRPNVPYAQFYPFWASGRIEYPSGTGWPGSGSFFVFDKRFLTPSRWMVNDFLPLALYGVTRRPGAERSEYFRKSNEARLQVPKIYCDVGNRLTQSNLSSAKAFRTVVNEIGTEIWNVWQANPGVFQVHPTGTPSPPTRKAFKDMFQAEIVDANTASVVSGALGFPIVSMYAGSHDLAGKAITVNQTQLDKQIPNMRDLVRTIE